MGVCVVQENHEDPYEWSPAEFYEEALQLRRIAGLNIVRAATIIDTTGDNEVSDLLISEAAVMLSVASKVEQLFRPPDIDVNI